MQDAHDPYGALKLPDYRKLLGGAVLGSLGAEMLHISVGWELYLRTDSALALGLAGLAQFTPVLLLALPAGHLADRYSRKHLLIAAQAILCCAALGLAVLSLAQGPVWLIYVCLVLVGMGRAFSAPARQSLVPQVVPLAVLPNAIAWNSTGWQLATMGGPALGGLVLAWFEPAAAYLLAAVAALVCIGLVSRIRPRPHDMPSAARSLHDLLAGVRFVWQTKPILATITLDLFAVLLGGATALLPIYARDILDVGPTGLGWLRAAPSVGAFVTALTLAHRRPFERPGRAMLVAVMGFGAAMIVFGISESFWLSLAMLALTGALDNVSVVIRGTIVQTLTPDHMRGRVAAVNIIFISSSNELGAFESGAVAALVGPVASVVIGGVGSILVALTVASLWPLIWAMPRPRAPKVETVAEAPPTERIGPSAENISLRGPV
jgi:MFS family permease